MEWTRSASTGRKRIREKFLVIYVPPASPRWQRGRTFSGPSPPTVASESDVTKTQKANDPRGLFASEVGKSSSEAIV